MVNICACRSRRGPRFKCWCQSEITSSQIVPSAECLTVASCRAEFLCLRGGLSAVLQGKAPKNQSCSLLITVNLSGKKRNFIFLVLCFEFFTGNNCTQANGSDIFFQACYNSISNLSVLLEFISRDSLPDKGCLPLCHFWIFLKYLAPI